MEELIPKWDLDNIGKYCYEHFDEKLKKPFTENTMIDILVEQSGFYDLWQAMIALRKIGTKNSIEHLKNVTLNYNGVQKTDIQGTSVLTIAKLSNGMENEFFGKLLLNENYSDKWYAMAAIFYENNEKALPYVLEYGIKNIEKSENMPDVWGLILMYLAQYASENEQSKNIFIRINKNIEKMDKKIKENIQNYFPEIFGVTQR
jgi:hypothetical protein